MNLFKGRHFKYEIIIWAVIWYCKYGISYRDLEEMAEERGLELDHSTIYRGVIFYAPKILKKLKALLQIFLEPEFGIEFL